MDQTPEELEREIAETRESLGEKVDAFTGQLKDGVDAARTKGLKVLGIAAASVAALIAVKKKIRSKRRS